MRIAVAGAAVLGAGSRAVGGACSGGCQRDDGSGALWMGTNSGSRKVSQLREDGRATLAHYDVSGMGYVTLIGSARLVDDLEERRRRWKPGWEPFYSEGPESHDYMLLMSFTHGVGADPSGFSPAILDRSGSGWVLRGES
ncbi:MAG: pyridoxamine 5'-phosphate oxidase family protein [Gemmatimonadetes bacterium]|nr:pyridoxamine 5'-phosphate oxidase family protein [Gemmatimonadota bacterium]NIO32778.1 pyridoxamine 5'-phosphate oxidase family protein [Gemmatimonadota bacterium]